MNTLQITNYLFWYCLTFEEQNNLKKAISARFNKKAYNDTDKKTFACIQGNGGK